jgi:hypothetical protein
MPDDAGTPRKGYLYTAIMQVWKEYEEVHKMSQQVCMESQELCRTSKMLCEESQRLIAMRIAKT